MVAKLSVHKNNVERRRARVLRDDLTQAAREMTSRYDIRAYAMVGIAADGSAVATWDTGAIMPMRAFPQMVAEILHDDLANFADIEDWRPALPAAGSTKRSV